MFPHLAKRGGKHVHLGARRGDYRSVWISACAKAGVPGIVRHDLRRSAARNLIRAGVPAGVVMSYTGHRSRSMLERYDITDQELDHTNAAAKLSSYISAGLSDNRVSDSEKPPRKRLRLCANRWDGGDLQRCWDAAPLTPEPTPP